MERSGSMLRALFVGVEPIVIGVTTNQQWLTLLGLCNLGIILLRHNTQPQTKSPLNSHLFSYKSQLNSLKTHNNYFGAIGFLGLVGGIVSYVLQIGDQYDKLALALITAGLAYWILSSVVHGIKATWHSGLSKIFAALILLGAGRSFLGSDKGQAFLDAFPTKVVNIFTIPKAIAPSQVDTGSTETTISNPATTMNHTGTRGITATGTNTGLTLPSAPIITTGTTTGQVTTSGLPYSQVVPAIVKAYGLVGVGPDVTFSNIAKTSDLYSAFKAGYNARFYGLGVNPNTATTCNVFFVMVGLAEKWPVTYTASNVFSAYAAEAEKRGKTYGCKSGEYVTAANLPQ